MAVSGTFTATGVSATVQISGLVPLSISGIAGGSVVELQRQLDGTNWRTVESFSADEEVNVQGVGKFYRLECTTFGSGTVAYVLGN